MSLLEDGDTPLKCNCHHHDSPSPPEHSSNAPPTNVDMAKTTTVKPYTNQQSDEKLTFGHDKLFSKFEHYRSTSCHRVEDQCCPARSEEGCFIVYKPHDRRRRCYDANVDNTGGFCVIVEGFVTLTQGWGLPGLDLMWNRWFREETLDEVEEKEEEANVCMCEGEAISFNPRAVHEHLGRRSVMEPAGRVAAGAGRCNWLLLHVLIVLLLMHGTSGDLVKQFVSASDDRSSQSVESYKDSGRTYDEPEFFDVGAILCQKYGDWTSWSPCSRKCEQTRVRKCRNEEECGRSWIKEKRTCMRPKGSCSPLTYKVIGTQKRNRMIEELLYDLLYSKWSEWGPCTRSCRQKRHRNCKILDLCEHSFIQEERRCRIPGTICEHRYSLKAVGRGRNNSTDMGSYAPFDDDDEDTETSDDESEEEGEQGGLAEGKRIPIPGVPNSFREEPSKSLNNVLVSGPGLVTSGLPPRGSSSNREKANGSRGSLTNFLSRKRERSRKKRRRLNHGKWPSALGREFIHAQKLCGYRPGSSRGGKSYRVVGGREVIKNSWPWQVAILTKLREQYCGGTLIAPRWVLTAAHCVRKKGKRRRLLVRVGEHDMAEYDPTQQDLRPEKEFPHPDFDYHTITNDIALIKLRTPPPAFTLPGYACLPSEYYSPSRHVPCNIVGWGKLKNTHLYGSDTLQEAKVPVVRHRRCQKAFTYAITKRQVCAGNKRGGIDSCAGDSGGPLLCPTNDNGTDRYVLYGVTSYGEGCGKKGKYGIYTKVSSYLNWIYKTISDNR